VERATQSLVRMEWIGRSWLHTLVFSALPVVLDGVVAAAVEEAPNLSPLVANGAVCSCQDVLFTRCPRLLANVRPQVILRARTAKHVSARVISPNVISRLAAPLLCISMNIAALTVGLAMDARAAGCGPRCKKT
jgi:hypothetical protein